MSELERNITNFKWFKKTMDKVFKDKHLYGERMYKLGIEKGIQLGKDEIMRMVQQVGSKQK